MTDPEIGKKLGYGGLITHGLGMYSITTKAILTKLAGSDPNGLKAIQASFTGPLTPGGKSLLHLLVLIAPNLT